MRILKGKTAWEKEWDILRRKEKLFLEQGASKKDSYLSRMLEEKVPEQLQDTLERAFAKAFALIFEKGTGIIEKTYNKKELEDTFKINQFRAQLQEDKKSLRIFSKKASSLNTKNLFISGIEGVGLGVLGIGLPDIPLFVGLILKSINEIALSYGYEYETEEEKYYILHIIKTALSYGQELSKGNHEIDLYTLSFEGKLPDNYSQKEQIKNTASALSKELLYMKFLQGIPLVGAAGGIYDTIYLRKILKYAKIKYQKRFLLDYKSGNDTNS